VILKFESAPIITIIIICVPSTAYCFLLTAFLMTKQYRWIKIADSVNEIDFSANQVAEVMAEEKKICIAKYQDGLFAFAHKCPHAGGFFIEGFIDALGNVVCPLHRYKYCLKNGRNVSGEGYYLKHWPVEIREDGVYVGFEVNKIFGWL
jgi:nitrite reductase/ring-hydroxylating ferredoxin subunit